ncbi:MAG: RhuM family protein [Sulfuricurvum sp.]
MTKTNSKFLIYQTTDGKTKIETRLENETVWLTQQQMADLFSKERSVITKHINNIFTEEELEAQSNVQILHISGSDKPVKFYSLDLIIAVGYRVKSPQGTKFRQWATARLKEYIVKGFAMDDERLKNLGGGSYFDELLSRIRDIRSSEKVFWRKVLDIYATSIDYDATATISMEFFKTIQNKMHWAVHGNTAAELIYVRADSTKENMGLTTFKGENPTKSEAEIAKNYLNETELSLLNRMVTAYLEIAEIQAMNHEPMSMKNWVERLDDFLKMTGKQCLQNGGTVSHHDALRRAHEEYALYKQKNKDALSRVEKDFLATLQILPKN